jgi:Holliday junction DNA helicase RuvA
MYEYINGILTQKTPVSIVIECGGVGYEIFIPLSTFDNLPEIGKQVKVQIHYSFNEIDGVRLFGFFSVEEKELFRYLISISKIGPKIALSILSGLSVEDLIHAIQTGNVDLISTIPGIGKKTAERLNIELKDKVSNIKIAGETYISKLGISEIVQEAETALITLGYRQFEIRKEISRQIKNNDFTTSEEIIKAIIKSLYKKRNV